MGNLISSTILFKNPKNLATLENSTQIILNVSFNLNETSSECGVNDILRKNEQVYIPNEESFKLLCLIYLVISIVSIVIAIIFLDNIEAENNDGNICWFLLLLKTPCKKFN